MRGWVRLVTATPKRRRRSTMTWALAAGVLGGVWAMTRKK